MKVVSFKDLAESDRISAFLVFGEELAPKKSAEEWKEDPRSKESPVGFRTIDNVELLVLSAC